MHRKAGRGLPGERYFFGGGVSGGGGGARDIESWRRIGKDGERRKKTFRTFWRRGVFIVVERLLEGVRLLGFFMTERENQSGGWGKREEEEKTSKETSEEPKGIGPEGRAFTEKTRNI